MGERTVSELQEQAKVTLLLSLEDDLKVAAQGERQEMLYRLYPDDDLYVKATYEIVRLEGTGAEGTGAEGTGAEGTE